MQRTLFLLLLAAVLSLPLGLAWAPAQVQAASREAQQHAAPADSVTLRATPLFGQMVGIYLSKRNLKFTPAYNLAVAHFLKQEDSLNLQQEELKLGFAIRLGHYLAGQMDQWLGTDSALFINAEPEFAQALIRAIQGPNLNLPTVQPFVAQYGLRYLLLVDLLEMDVTKQPHVYAVSNRLYTEHRTVHTGKVQIRLYDLRDNSLLSQTEVAYGPGRELPESSPYLPPQETSAPAEQLLLRLLNPALTELFGAFE